jgi:hypothetical protein
MSRVLPRNSPLKGSYPVRCHASRFNRTVDAFQSLLALTETPSPPSPYPVRSLKRLPVGARAWAAKAFTL